jgi:S-adenosyl-L-methionine hydrolase (adenosine-forming)
VSRIVTLTTDFGSTDAYVGIMKGVILSIAPETRIVDISHEVPPQDVTGAATLLDSVWEYFPADAIHVAVVDPGVGTNRKPIAVRAGRGLFVGPDNGLFGPVLTRQGNLSVESGTLRDAEAVELVDERYRLSPVSPTFHGRDIFAPAAAHLALGLPLASFGPPLTSIEPGTSFPLRREGTMIYGAVVRIDRFGNAITNVPSRAVGGHILLSVRGHCIPGIRDSYQDAPLGVLVGSRGTLEIAVRDGSAARELGLQRGDPVTVENAS